MGIEQSSIYPLFHGNFFGKYTYHPKENLLYVMDAFEINLLNAKEEFLL
jgi:hypothetical protein